MLNIEMVLEIIKKKLTNACSCVQLHCTAFYFFNASFSSSSTIFS